MFNYFTDMRSTSPATRVSWESMAKLAMNPKTSPKDATPCITFNLAADKKLNTIVAHDDMTASWIDIDQGDLELKDLVESLKEAELLSFIVYSTSSSTAEDKRWRVLVELYRAVTCQQWLMLQQNLANSLGGDSSAVRLQQIAFVPTNPGGKGFYQCHVEKGLPLDVDFLPEWFEENLVVEVADLRVDGGHEVIRDAVSDSLERLGFTTGVNPKGGYQCDCPFSDEHTDPEDKQGGVYFPAGNHPGAEVAAYVCMHDSCREHGVADLRGFLLANDPDFTAEVLSEASEGFEPIDDSGTKTAREKLPYCVTGFAFLKGDNKFYEYATGTVMSAQAFNQSTPGVEVEQENGKTKKLNAATAHKAAGGDIVDDMVWKPWTHNKPEGRMFNGGEKVHVNIYRPPRQVEPDGDDLKIKLFLKHGEYLIPDEAERNVLYDHMAYTMQYVERKIQWQIILIGMAGTGKDAILRPLAHYFGKMFSEIRTHDAEANKWGDSMIGKKVIQYSEIFQPRDKVFYNSLKTMAAGTSTGSIRLNIKGGGQVTQQNVFSVYGMSNHDDCIHLEASDRRWFIIGDTSRVRTKPESYYDALFDWYDNQGGLRAVAAWLLARDVSKFQYGRLPFHTDARNRLVEHSVPSLHVAIEDMLLYDRGPFTPGRAVFCAEMVKEYLEETRVIRFVSVVAVGAALKELNFFKYKERARTSKGGVEVKRTVYRNPNYEGRVSPPDEGEKGGTLYEALMAPPFEGVEGF